MTDECKSPVDPSGSVAYSSSRRWELDRREGVYDGFYRIDKLTFRHELHTGELTGPIEQELIVRGNVVGLLPYDPVIDSVALVEQFRIGALRQKPDPWLMEVIAGMIDKGEAPEQAVIREGKEEAGVELADVELLSHYLASPGSSSEEVFIYYAETDLSDVGGLHGLADENEDIRVHVVSVDEAFDMLKRGQIRNAISIIALQSLQIRRLQLNCQ